jgi:hypothetical protein
MGVQLAMPVLSDSAIVSPSDPPSFAIQKDVLGRKAKLPPGACSKEDGNDFVCFHAQTES